MSKQGKIMKKYFPRDTRIASECEFYHKAKPEQEFFECTHIIPNSATPDGVMVDNDDCHGCSCFKQKGLG